MRATVFGTIWRLRGIAVPAVRNEGAARAREDEVVAARDNVRT